ncbi:transposase domain-containing protein [Streptomyces sp. NPDC097727]|uniref:transposase domain-containing protein n=1 Tax=Streptomyces sp. NPDC097727 TaxID=3366092 RepID=UPI00380A8AEE
MSSPNVGPSNSGYGSRPRGGVVDLLLDAALFEKRGYLAVWSKLTSALGSLTVPKVTGTALWHTRARLGVRPMRALFDLVRGPRSAIRTAGARWAGLLVVAVMSPTPRPPGPVWARPPTSTPPPATPDPAGSPGRLRNPRSHRRRVRSPDPP